MAEKSYLWTTGGAGDGASEYTRTEWSTIIQLVAMALGPLGVIRSWRNALALSSTGANNVRVAPGGALVDGKPYDSTTNVDVTIPSAVGGGNTRIDRIVLSCDWTAQTIRVVRLAGTDAASPAAPALTQTPGTLYQLSVCRVLVNTSGAITITDERTWTDGSNTLIPVDEIASGAALSVLGRAANSVGELAGIVAGANDRILARVSNALSWVQLTIGMIPDALITTAKLANDAVDDTKAGNRVARMVRRQGSNAGYWHFGGSTNYTPTGVLVQVGAVECNGSGEATITFPIAFSTTPIVMISCSNLNPYIGTIQGHSNTGFTLHTYNSTNLDPALFPLFNWVAIGPE